LFGLGLGLGFRLRLESGARPAPDLDDGLTIRIAQGIGAHQPPNDVIGDFRRRLLQRPLGVGHPLKRRRVEVLGQGQ
jgi:hypothetical protein